MNENFEKDIIRRHQMIASIENARRNRIKQRAYIENGLGVLFHNPMTSIFALVSVCAASMLVWRTADTVALLAPTFPSLQIVVVWTARILLEILLLLLLIGVLYLIGTPRNASKVEETLAKEFQIGQEEYYRRPFLMQKKPIKGSIAFEYIFWTEWVSIDKWESPKIKAAIMWSLDSNTTASFVEGKRKYTISLTAAPGVVQMERETPKDPHFS